MSMKAARWQAVQNVTLDEIETPKVGDGEVLLRVESCAICGSDVRTFFHGNDRIVGPKILGHELAGTVVELGRGVKRFKTGERIAVGADIPCGKCRYCLSGAANNCKTNLAIGYQFEGGFAEYIKLPASAVDGGPVQSFSNQLSFDEAALSEPLACCINGYEIGLMKPGKIVAIWGAGPIGMMLADLGFMYGAEKIFMIDIDESRLNSARALRPKLVTLDARNNIKEEIMAHTDGHGVELIFTANSAIESHKQALEVVAKRGVINFFGGLPKNAPPLTISSNWVHYNEIYLTGSHGSTPKQHEAAIRLIENKKIIVADLISHHFKLNDIQDAFQAAISKKGLKIMVNPNGK